MAKLSARGRSVLATYTKTIDSPYDGVEYRRVSYALCDDGQVLKKLAVKFAATDGLKAYVHSFGWKNHSKYSVVAIDEMVEKLTDAGFEKE